MSKLISEKMNDALNGQIGNELGASHNYLAMAAAFDDMGLKILAARFVEQSEEEREHAMKIYKYVLETGGKVQLGEIGKPKTKYKDAKEVIKAALDSELTVTRQINDLITLAEGEKDYAARSFLQWFVDEQVEEVSSMRELMQVADLARDMLQVEARVRHEMTKE
jgi:ferritin